MSPSRIVSSLSRRHFVRRLAALASSSVAALCPTSGTAASPKAAPKPPAYRGSSSTTGSSSILAPLVSASAWSGPGQYNVSTIVAGLPFKGTALGPDAIIGSITLAWCGAAFDYATSTMHIVAHGGHGDSWLNESYAIQVPNGGWVKTRAQTSFPPDQHVAGYAPVNGINVGQDRLPTRGDGFYIPAGATSATQVTPFVNNASVYFDGAPCSRHTYGGECWLPTQQRVLLMTGATWGGGGGYDWYVGWFDPATGSWTRKANHPQPYNGLVSSYYAGGDKVIWCSNGTAYCYAYDPATDTHTRLDSGAAPFGRGFGGPFTQICCAPDASSGLWYVYMVMKGGMASIPGCTVNSILRLKLGQGTRQAWEIVNVTGDVTGMNGNCPGIEYDPDKQALVFYAASDPSNYSVLRLTDFAIERVPIQGAAPNVSATSSGIWGRFRRYAPHSYVLFNSPVLPLSLITLP